MFFIGVFGIEENAKILRTIRNFVCPACGRYAAVEVIFLYTYFHFFFIPLFKWNKTYIIRLTCCGAQYTCDQETKDDILRTGEIDFGKCLRQREGQNHPDECPWCGGRLEGDFVFCPYCGKRL